MPFISRAKQNREINGHEYQLQAKIGRKYSISNCMGLIRQNKGAKIIEHAKSPTFRAAKLKGFTVYMYKWKEYKWQVSSSVSRYSVVSWYQNVSSGPQYRCRQKPVSWYYDNTEVLPITSISNFTSQALTWN